VAIGFVPFVGPALDLCEAVTGHEYCMPSGRTLSTEERIMSGVGFGVGKLVKVWGGVKTAAISAEGKATAAGILSLSEEFAEILKEFRRKSFKTLIGAVSPKKPNDFEMLAARYLTKNQGHKLLGAGDDAVRKMVNIAESSATKGVSVACDYLSVSKTGGLILSEAKEITNALGQMNTPHAIDQLNNVMKKLVEKNLAQDVEIVQIITSKPIRLKKGYGVKLDGRLFIEATDQFVHPTGRPDLIIQVVEL
jgi:hypothetical protein